MLRLLLPTVLCLLPTRPATTQTDWTGIGPAPTARRNFAMAMNPDQARVLVFGGDGAGGYATDAAYDWNGVGWGVTTRPFGLSVSWPHTRTNTAAASDSAGRRVLLYGGYDGSSYYSDLWAWRSGAWTGVAVRSQPPARAGHAMAYDDARQRLVVFGGGTATAFATAETWEFDGTTWAQRATPNAPPASLRAAMCYDAARHRMVLIGAGLGGNDTWEYDGADWSLRTPAHRPPVQIGPALAFDPRRSRTVLSVNNQTWEWDGSDWTQVVTAHTPPPMSGHGLAYDAEHRRMLLFGGTVSIIPYVVSAELWSYDGNDWTPLHSGVAPPARSRTMLAYDRDREVVVLFGGRGSGGSLNDTWELRGSEWIPRAPQLSPAPRDSAMLVYDARSRNCVLFGGINANNQYLTDTWLYDGTNWQPTYQIGPPPRFDYAMTFDELRQEVVLFGGSQGTGGWRNDTWIWNGSFWLLRQPATSPPAQGPVAMASDPVLGTWLVLGQPGLASLFYLWNGITWIQRTVPPPGVPSPLGLAADTVRHVLVEATGSAAVAYLGAYEWDANQWSIPRPFWSPTGRDHAAVVCDAARHRTLLVGGEDAALQPRPDTWAYSTAVPSCDRIGVGCAGTAGVPDLTAERLPWLAAGCVLRASNVPAFGYALLLHGYSDQQWGPVPLPLALATLGAPGCALQVAVDLILVAQSGASTSVTFGLPIPNDATLTGLRFFDQVATVDPGANALGLAFSAAAMLKVGGR